MILSRKFMGFPRCLISANTLIGLKKTSIHNLYKRGKVMFRHDLMTFEEFTILSSLSKTNFCTQSFIDQNLCQGVLKVHFYQIKGFKIRWIVYSILCETKKEFYFLVLYQEIRSCFWSSKSKPFEAKRSSIIRDM